MGEQGGSGFHVRNTPRQLPVDFLLFRPVSAEDIGIEELLHDPQSDQESKNVDFDAMISNQKFNQVYREKTATQHHRNHETVKAGLQGQRQTGGEGGDPPK